jgi:hypothetical protein
MIRTAEDLAGELARFIHDASAGEAALAGRVTIATGLVPETATFNVATVEGALFDVRVTTLREAP